MAMKLQVCIMNRSPVINPSYLFGTLHAIEALDTSKSAIDLATSNTPVLTFHAISTGSTLDKHFVLDSAQPNLRNISKDQPLLQRDFR